MKHKRTIAGIAGVLATVLLLAGCTNEIIQPEKRSDGKARVSFTAPIVAESVSTRAALTEKTTVRVVAYVASSMDYKADQAYYVDSNGKLKPCTVNDDGTFKAIDTTSELALFPDTYDFYAYTPALPLNADHKTVNVPNGIDYATSVTDKIKVSTNQTQPLTELARKCAKIALVIKKADDNTEMSELSVTGNGVTLSVLPATATNIQLNTDIPAASGTATLSVPAASFSLNETTSNAAIYLLPRLGTDRMELAYDLTYKAANTTETKTFNGTMGNIALDKGKSYTFTLTVRKTGATLSVKDWIDGGLQDVGISTVDYTDNGKAWFTIIGGDAYNPIDLSKTTMDWYVATGTVDQNYNPDGKKPCPDGWRIADLSEMNLMWVYKQATPHVPYASASSEYYWTASSSGIYGWKASMFNGAVFYNNTTEKNVQHYVRCIKDVTAAQSYPYVAPNLSGEKRVIVSQDDNGGVRAGAIRTTIMGTIPEHLQTDDSFNSVPAKLEIAKKDCDDTTAPGVPQTNGTYTWADAPRACAAYHESINYSDTWRLPTQRELILIRVVNQKGLFDNSISPFLAKSYRTITAIGSIGNPLFWIINMDTGASTTSYKTSLFRIRCVRDL